MNLMRPTPLPYDAAHWATLPFTERAQLVCQAWAIQGYGSPIGAYGFYALKLALYIAGFLGFCRFDLGYGQVPLGAHLLTPIAFQKAIVWSMLFEGLGLGCGSGPLTGRYMPPFGGFLYFLRRGTTKLALFPRAHVIGGVTRSWLDVLLYAAVLALLVRALIAPQVTSAQAWPIVAVVAALGVCDKTLFLAFRSEHYWTTCLCFALTSDWLPGCKAVYLGLWFWAGVSKLNAHFPAVVCVMTSNSPVTRLQAFRRLMYRNYPDDLRPSRVAHWGAHAGTFLELGVPTVLLFASGAPWLQIGMVMMLALHLFITSNVPMGVPIEWNFMMVYGAVVLFWMHPDVSALSVSSPWLALCLTIMLILVPAFGNVWPERVSFLLAMRFYAGNWAYGVWLFHKDSTHKLERLTKAAPALNAQLERFYDPATARGLLGKVMAFRLMHLHGRALPLLLPRAVPRFEDYDYFDGELIAGLALGWNFGDGHLHNTQLLQAIQAQCQFAPGELRCVFVESQPLFGKQLSYQLVDASTGVLERGQLPVAELLTRQPWAARA